MNKRYIVAHTEGLFIDKQVKNMPVMDLSKKLCLTIADHFDEQALPYDEPILVWDLDLDDIYNLYTFFESLYNRIGNLKQAALHPGIYLTNGQDTYYKKLANELSTSAVGIVFEI